LNGEPPFQVSRDKKVQGGSKELFRRIMSEKVKMPPGSTAAACKLLKGLLSRNVQQRLGTSRSTFLEVGGVTALKNMEFFKDIPWDRLALKDFEPPHIMTVSDDHDLKHFHEEFTGMALPRSVMEMSKEDFQPRRIASEAFRGFSFIKEDFDLPERDEEALQLYWDSVEDCGKSESECASDRMGEEIKQPQELEKKKRPPRKKKKNTDAIPSVVVEDETPSKPTETSEDDKKNAPGEQPKPLPPPVQYQNIPEDNKKKTLGEQPKPSPPPVQQQNIPAAPPPKPVAKETWQSSTKKKGSKPLANNGQVPSRGGPPQPRTTNYQQRQNQNQPQVRGAARQGTMPQATTRNAPEQQRSGWGAASRPTHGSQAAQQGGGTWGTRTSAQPPARQTVIAPPQSPSSDWRDHNMSSPRSARRSVGKQPQTQPSWPSLATDPPPNHPQAVRQTQPSWPSLSTDPPLNPQAKHPIAASPLRGTWATRPKS
jgi:hypothetical protein